MCIEILWSYIELGATSIDERESYDFTTTYNKSICITLATVLDGTSTYRICLSAWRLMCRHVNETDFLPFVTLICFSVSH